MADVKAKTKYREIVRLLNGGFTIEGDGDTVAKVLNVRKGHIYHIINMLKEDNFRVVKSLLPDDDKNRIYYKISR